MKHVSIINRFPVIAGLIVAICSLAFATDARGAENYKIDSAHAWVMFRIAHFEVGNSYGRFNNPTGTVVLDKQDLTKSSFTFEVKVEDIDTDNEKRDAHLKSPDFFDAKQFPTISFKSKSVKPMSENKFEIVGDLTLHGVTKEITIAMDKLGEKDTGKMGGYRTGWETKVDLKRSDYGMNSMIGPVGDDVHILISYEAVRE